MRNNPRIIEKKPLVGSQSGSQSPQGPGIKPCLFVINWYPMYRQPRAAAATTRRETISV